MALRPAGVRPALLVGLVMSATQPFQGAAAPPVGGARTPVDIARETGRVTSPPRTAEPTSNMGFKWEGDFKAVPDFKNIYIVAVPYFLGATDIANSAAPDPCDPAGARDGVVNADDLLCDWWTSREGAMSVSRRDEPSGTWQTRTAFRDDTTRRIEFIGTWLEPLVLAEGYLVQVSGPNGGAMSNPAVIVGSHNPAFSGHVLQLPVSGEPQESVINVPYHSMYQTADEILCGLEGLDWFEGPDGNPTTCPTNAGSGGSGGIFDNLSGAPMTIALFDNYLDGNGTDNEWVWRTVSKDATGALVFEGMDYDIWPGSPPASGGTPGQIAWYGPPFVTSTFLSPHF